MHVQNETELVVFQDWTLRIRAAIQGPPRLLVLVHGWTGDENSMWVFVRNFPASYCIVAPRAPFPTEPSGYSWRPVQGGLHERPTFAELRPAVESLLDLVDAYGESNSLDVTHFDAMGFSQGAGLVSSLALLHPERIERAGILAGFVPDGAEAMAADRPLRGKPIFVAHGTRDEMVNVEIARRSAALLEEAGAHVTYCEDEVGHKLSAKCLRGLQEFFKG